VVVLALLLICGVLCSHLTQLWNVSKSYNRITKGFKLKNYEKYRSFAVSPMKANKRPMHLNA